MAKVDLKLEGRVAVVTMNEGDNRLNSDMCDSLLEVLDKVEKETDALTLVVKSGHERIWSNGFDTDWISLRQKSADTKAVIQFLLRDIELRSRILTFPLITIAAIDGHVFGGGAVLSCCFDFRFMRSDRGFFCIPAVDRNYPIVPGTAALLKKAMPAYLAQEAVLTGRKYTAVECIDHGLVTAAYTSDELMGRVMTFATGLNKGREIVREMKQVLYKHIVEVMQKDDEEYILKGKIVV